MWEWYRIRVFLFIYLFWRGDEKFILIFESIIRGCMFDFYDFWFRLYVSCFNVFVNLRKIYFYSWICLYSFVFGGRLLIEFLVVLVFYMGRLEACMKIYESNYFEIREGVCRRCIKTMFHLRQFASK